MKSPIWKKLLSIARGALPGCALAFGAALLGNFLGGSVGRVITTTFAGLIIGAAWGWASTTLANGSHSVRTGDRTVIYVAPPVSAPRYLEYAASRFDRHSLGHSSAAYRWWNAPPRSKTDFTNE